MTMHRITSSGTIQRKAADLWEVEIVKFAIIHE